MRANIKIVGLGPRMAGTSKKNGKPYDFIPASFLFQDKNFTGYRAATANIDGPMVDAAGGLQLNQEREVFYHTFNNSIIVDGIL